MDVNNNEQLDEEDFKLLRAKKSDYTIRKNHPLLGALLGGGLGAAGGYFASDDNDKGSILDKKKNKRNALIAGLLGMAVGSRIM